jgi:zinc-ribbon domain
MHCPNCSHDNPESNRFCGNCGARLPATATVNDYFQDRLQVGSQGAVRKSTGSAPVSVAKPPSPAKDVPESLINKSSAAFQPAKPLVETRNETPAANGRTLGIGGPSFLGLNYEPRQSKPFIYDNDETDTDYLLDEAPRRSFWRAYALLALVLVASGLGWMQWRSQRTGSGIDFKSILNKYRSALPRGETKSKDSAPPTGASENSVASGAQKTGSEDSAQPELTVEPRSKGADTGGATSNSTSNSKEVVPGADLPKPQQGAASSAGDKHPRSAKLDEGDDSERDESASETASAKAASVPEKKRQREESLGASDPLLLRAQDFLHGRRGLRRDCQAGLNLLRQSVAHQNPKAQVQMGALYMSGHCVARDRVAAYDWFGRALMLDPDNLYIERNRALLWASMTSQERARVR